MNITLYLAVVMVGVLVACSNDVIQELPNPTAIPNTAQEENRELGRYLDLIDPLMERHGDTTQIVNAANVRIQQQSITETNLARQAALLDEWIDQLEWAVPRLRQDLDEAQRTTSPRIALAFHGKLIETIQFDFIGISGLLSHSVRFRNTGFNDLSVLNNANEQLLHGRLAASEMQTLLVELSN